MPERLDRVTIQLRRRPVAITWNEREALLAELVTKHHDRPTGDPSVRRAVCKAFEDVGASRAVIFTLEQKAHVASALNWWSAYAELAPGLLELRNALEEDLQDAVQCGGESARVWSAERPKPGGGS